MSSSELMGRCDKLRSSLGFYGDALTRLGGLFPSARQDCVELSRSMLDLDLTSQRLGHTCIPFDEVNTNIPDSLLAPFVNVVQTATLLVKEVNDVLKASVLVEEPQQATLHKVADWLKLLGPLTKTIRTAMELETNLLQFIIDYHLLDPSAETSPCNTSQFVQKVDDLMVLLDSVPQNYGLHDQRAAILELVEAVQQYLHQIPNNTGSPRSSSGAQTGVSSHQSDIPEAIPDYHAIGITNPAPLDVSLRHIAKRELSNHELVQVAFLTRNSQPTIAISTMEPPTRFFDVNTKPVSLLSNQHGVSMCFSPDARCWAYQCENDSKHLNAWSHDGSTFKEPVVHLGDYINGRKLQQLRWPSAKPLSFSPDGQWLAVRGARNRIVVLDVKAGAAAKPSVISCHSDEVTHAVFTPDGKALVSQSRDGTIRLTDPHTRASIAKFEMDTWKKPLFLGVLPETTVVVAIWGDVVFHWNYTTSSVESYSLGAKRSRQGWPMAISHDCRFLCCRTDEGVDVSDLHSGRVLYTIKFQSGYATAAAFSADGRYLAIGKAASWMWMKPALSTLVVWELIF